MELIFPHFSPAFSLAVIINENGPPVDQVANTRYPCFLVVITMVPQKNL